MDQKPTGRPTKLTKNLQKEFCDAVRRFLPVVRCCHLLGIEEATFYLWSQRAEAGDQPYKTFIESVNRAKAEAQDGALSLIHKAASDKSLNFTPMAWLLERTARKEFGRYDQIAVETAKPFDANALLKELQDRKTPEQES